MSFSSYDEYCNYFQATFNKVSGKSESNEVGEGEAAEGSNAIEEREKRTRGKERNRPVKNRMFPTHWPPENATELHLDRW